MSLITAGISGAGGTGKSTLAKAFAKRYNLPLVESPAADVYREFGVDPKENINFTKRMAVQTEILARALKSYREHKVFVSDRTPLDFLAYMMADIQRADELTELEQGNFARYAQLCMDVTSDHFGLIMVVQPGIPYAEHAKRTLPNPAYQEHLNTLILGMLADTRLLSVSSILHRHCVNHDERLEALEKSVHEADRLMKQRAGKNVSIAKHLH